MSGKLFRFDRALGSVLSILLGILFIVLGAYVLLNPKEYDSSATAEISSIEVTGSEWVEDANGYSELRDTYTVYVDFEHNGEKVTHCALTSWSSSMKVGQELEIVYDSHDLTTAALAGFDFLPVIFIAVGSLTSALGVVRLVRQKKRGESV